MPFKPTTRAVLESPTRPVFGLLGLIDGLVYRFNITEESRVPVFKHDYTSDFINSFDAGFTLYTKVVWPTSGYRVLFSASVDGGLIASISGGNIIRVSNWQSFQDGTTSTYTPGEVVGILIRHDGTNTKIYTQPLGELSPTLESDQTRAYTRLRSTSPVAWGGQYALSVSNYPTGVFSSAMYDSALWLGDVVSEANALDLLAGNLGIGDIVATPKCWFDAETGRDKSDSTELLVNYGTRPTVGLGISSIMINPETFEPVLHDAGAGAVYWAVRGGSTTPMRLSTSTDLVTWTDYAAAGDILPAESQRFSNDFIYLGGEAGAHPPFAIFYKREAGEGSPTNSVINLMTSSDMTTWTQSPSNPILNNPTGPGNGVEDFRIAKLASGRWMGVFEQDDLQTTGARAVGAAEYLGTVPIDDAWTVEAQDILGTGDVGYEISGQMFMANPCLCRNGNDLWLFYEGADFANGPNAPTTLARKTTISDDVFNPLSYKKWGVVTWDYNRKAFANNAYINGGQMFLLCNNGPGAISGSADEVRAWPFDPSISVGVRE